MKRFLSVLIILIIALAATPVAAAPGTIVDIAVGDPGNFSILVEALTKADLVDTLSGDGPFTVFAPTDAAFADLLTDLGVTKQELLDHPDLKNVLLYHVLSGEVLSTALTDGMTAATLQGENLDFDLGSTPPLVNDAQITTTDIVASNGVIHVIDKVLVPESFGKDSIVGIAAGNPDFSILVAALKKADLANTLSGAGPFTVFAPTNAAFEKLLTALDISAEDLLAQPDLAKVLLHHVISGRVLSTSLSDGLSVETLNKDKLAFDLVKANGPFVNDAKISGVDIVGSNGVIHVIDDVMIPTNFTIAAIDDDTEIPQTGDTWIYLAGGLVFAGLVLLIVNNRRRLMGKDKSDK